MTRSFRGKPGVVYPTVLSLLDYDGLLHCSSAVID